MNEPTYVSVALFQAVQEENERLREALRTARDVFDGYAKHHEKKGDLVKSGKNAGYAWTMREALGEE